LLPERDDPLAHGDTLREYTAEMTVEAGSPLQGCSIEKAGLRSLPGLFLAEIERDGSILPAVEPRERLQANDRLIFVGAIESVVDLHRIRGLMPATDQVFKLEGARDTLLLEAHPDFIDRHGRSRDFLLVSEVGGFHPPNHEGAPMSLAIVIGMVVLAATGWLSMLEAALVAAGLMLLSGCTSGQVARRSPDWQVLVVIATSFGIGAALQGSGAAGVLADGIIGLAGGNPWATLTLVFAATALLSAVATNNVAAVLAFPIALSAAAHMNVNIMPFAITIMVAASASFATPIGYQTNLMIYNAGGYRFADFMRIGLPLTVLVGLLTVVLVPLIWRF
jgi:hypothetical protein